jgi:penicillin-binding protein 2
MQVAFLTALIAARGVPVRPRLVSNVPAAVDPAPPADSLFKESAFEEIIAGMWRSANDGGTGAGARVDGFDVCGKTGSTQTMSRESAERLARAGRVIKTHSWFSGFAPRVDPRIVVTVLVEFGGGGGATAAPVAGRLFALWKERMKPR